MSTDRPYLSLIIPAYNEAGRIRSTLQTVTAHLDTLGRAYEVIVVDDGSTDDTRRLTIDFASETTAVRIVSYRPNRGKGYAVRQGVFASRGEYIAFSDADLSAPIEQLGKLFAAIEKGYDIAIGSRAVKGAEIPVHQPFYRELGGKALNLVIRLLAVPGIHDTQCGFKLFRGDVARAIFEKCFIDRWAFDVEELNRFRSNPGFPRSWGSGSICPPARLQDCRDTGKMESRRELQHEAPQGRFAGLGQHHPGADAQIRVSPDRGCAPTLR